METYLPRSRESLVLGPYIPNKFNENIRTSHLRVSYINRGDEITRSSHSGVLKLRGSNWAGGNVFTRDLTRG